MPDTRTTTCSVPFGDGVMLYAGHFIYGSRMQNRRVETAMTSDNRRRAMRARVVVCALLALVAVLSPALPSSAKAGGGDAAATRTYLEVNYRFVHDVASRIRSLEKALHGALTQVRGECPAAAAGSPQNAASEQLSNEVVGTLVQTVVPMLVRPASLRFVLVAGALKWSDPTLTRTIHTYTSKLERLATIGQPSLCSDVRVWAASGFRTLPGSTIRFSRRFMANWVSAGELPAALARYETPAERPLIRRTEGLEAKIAELEAREVETWDQIMHTLQLWP
jgi:hypothetical protein